MWEYCCQVFCVEVCCRLRGSNSVWFCVIRAWQQCGVRDAVPVTEISVWLLWQTTTKAPRSPSISQRVSDSSCQWAQSYQEGLQIKLKWRCFCPMFAFCDSNLYTFKWDQGMFTVNGVDCLFLNVSFYIKVFTTKKCLNISIIPT